MLHVFLVRYGVLGMSVAVTEGEGGASSFLRPMCQITYLDLPRNTDVSDWVVVCWENSEAYRLERMVLMTGKRKGWLARETRLAPCGRDGRGLQRRLHLGIA